MFLFIVEHWRKGEKPKQKEDFSENGKIRSGKKKKN